ncbi:MAG: ABC transporter substrate-binding protein [Hyphomonadaceae bacterium]|nr:ABC transporter substrate-binding protein [Hyphomonadaceae bacterium]
MMRTALISLATMFLASAAHAGIEAETLIAETANELAAGAIDSEELDNVVDTSAIARFTLGHHVRNLPEQDVQRFSAAFDRFLETTFDDQAARFSGAQIDVIGSVDRSARDSIVTTRVTLPGELPETVRWRVINRDGAWKVVDVQAFGLWLAIEQRAQIAAILDRNGASIDDVIASLDNGDAFGEANG